MPLSPVITALDTEWTHTRTAPASAAALRAWAAREPALRRYRDLASLEAHAHDCSTPAVDVDAVFAALLRTHHLDDPTAGRVVLALLLPAVKRRRPHHRVADDHTATVLAALWHGICRYPLLRKPRRIPANLILDAHRDATPPTNPHREVPWCEQSPPPADDDSWVERIHTRTDLELAAMDTGVAYRDLQLIARTRVAGWPIAAFADSTGAARLRQRRRRAEARLARHLTVVEQTASAAA